VALKWFLNEPLAEASAGLLALPDRLIAPELLLSEVTHALLKRYRRGELENDEIESAVSRLPELVSIVSAASLNLNALEIAKAYDRSAYDALYVALALKQECRLVTADERLYNALVGAYPTSLMLLGNPSAMST
jgi:predicted nucleic acid-binding protein